MDLDMVIPIPENLFTYLCMNMYEEYALLYGV